MPVRPELALLGAVVLALPASAQQAPQAPQPPHYRVVEFQSPGTEMFAYRGGFEKLIKVATAAKAPASASWNVYTTENRTVVVRQVERNNLLANPNAAIMEAQREMWQEAMASMPRTGTVQTRNEIWIAAPDWSYEPANAPEFTGVSVADVPVAPGMGAAADSVRRDFVKFRQKIGYPYVVRAFRVVLGEPRTVYVTEFDSREKFFGVNALNALVEKANAGAEWQALATRLVATVGMDWKTTLWNYAKNMSYAGTGGM
jgi:hypothetical protein